MWPRRAGALAPGPLVRFAAGMRQRIAARIVVASVVASAVGLASRAASAQTTDQCLDAFHRGQDLRDRGALREARGQFVVCSRSTCPALVRADCTESEAAVLRELPSIVPGARRLDGSDIVALSIRIDGKPVATNAGAALELDPGVHQLHIESPGYQPASTSIVVRVGERNRPVLLTLEESSSAPSTSLQSPRSWAWPLAGVGVLALGSFAGFGIHGLVDRADARDRCAPRCPPGEESRIRTQFIVADVSLVVGALALAGALAVHLTQPAHQPQGRGE